MKQALRAKKKKKTTLLFIPIVAVNLNPLPIPSQMIMLKEILLQQAVDSKSLDWISRRPNLYIAQSHR